MGNHESIGKRFKDLRTSQKDKYGKELPGLQMAQKLVDNQCIENYSADVIRQEISKVEKEGKFPQLYLIEGYCKYFNVTSDYLLGLRETKTVDENLAMINKVTGLDDNAINTLKKLNTIDKGIISIDTLNFIMKDFYTFSLFLSNIHNFISGDYDTPIYFERGKNGKGYSKPKIGADIKKESPLSSEEEKKENYLYIQNSNSKDKGYIIIPVSMTKTFFMDCIRQQLELWKEECQKGE